MANYKNYSISSGKGKLYLKEKTPTEGYEEITYGTEGKKTYHKYADNIKGFPKSLEVKEIEFEGKTLKFIELTLIDGEDHNKVSAPLKNVKGNYTDEAKALISALSGLNLGEEVTLTVKTTVTQGKNNKEYKNLNVYINYTKILGENNKGLSTGFIHFNDIPKPIEKVVAGDKVYDWSPQTEFYYAKLGELVTKFQTSTATDTPPPPPADDDHVGTTPKHPKTATAQEAFEPASSFKEEDHDDLPF